MLCWTSRCAHEARRGIRVTVVHATVAAMPRNVATVVELGMRLPHTTFAGRVCAHGTGHVVREVWNNKETGWVRWGRKLRKVGKHNRSDSHTEILLQVDTILERVGCCSERPNEKLALTGADVIVVKIKHKKRAHRDLKCAVCAAARCTKARQTPHSRSLARWAPLVDFSP